MRPTIRNGDVVTLAPVGTRPPAPGDIVAIRTADRLVVHRVVTVHVDSTGQARLVTRGDAHADTDPPVPATAVLGRVTAVHRRTVFTRVRDMCHRWGLASGERWP